MKILITTGTYNTKDYRVVKEYKREKFALRYAKSIGYPYHQLSNHSWNYYGIKYSLDIY